ncbi:hypothetical protein [Rhizobium laguerreae]|uniref:hypothetical protein n=1 Tax=Rhizobium laguerreae TaxID=1076926 RepID=UPI001FEB76D9|nr:hypothetical protein [Rhizobium laguerreae]
MLVDILDGDLGTYIKRVYNERGFDINLNGISRLVRPDCRRATGPSKFVTFACGLAGL